MNGPYWEQRYQTGDMPWEKGAASPGLVDFLAANRDLPRGTVCVPGCGTGHDVREWARAGFNACGYDIAPSAIRLATEMTPDNLKASFQLANFLADPPPFQFDWLFEHTLFCAIDRGLREEYVRAVLRWLKPGGCYLAVNYLVPDEDDTPPFSITRDEQWQRFSPRFDLLKEWVPRSYPNRTGLELMFWWRRKSTDSILGPQAR